MLNPDGVIVGNYRTSLIGADLNRRWKTPSKMLHPTIFATKRLIKDFARERQCELICDLHGHSRRKNVFMYGCHVQGRPEASRLIPFLMGKISPFFVYEYCRFKVQKSKESTMRVALFKETRIPEVYTMESTFCGADQGEFSGLHMTTAQLKSLGESLLQALLTKSGLAPTTDDPMPSPEDIGTPISLAAAMEELMGNEELL
jgi:hypothetical protein